MDSIRTRWLTCCAAFLVCASAGVPAQVAGEQPPPDAQLLANIAVVPSVTFPALDHQKLANEDVIADLADGGPKRFAVARDVMLTPANSGEWDQLADGSWVWRLKVIAAEAMHLNFGFRKFDLPSGAALQISRPDGAYSVGPFTEADELPHGQLWTQVVPGDAALVILTVPNGALDQVNLELTQINQGYRGFGSFSKVCKSGACNMDVACLGASDPWNAPRRSVGAITRGGTDTCTGSLLNNTSNDRRMLFVTATHCGLTSDSVVATVLVFWNYEAATCRTPGSAASGQPFPKPNTTSPGLRFVAGTNNPFAGSTPANTRSDTTLIELATPAANNPFNLFWAGWDRRPPPTVCAPPGDPTSTAGLCASIHHPGVDEKRITFVQENMTVDNISGATGVHWRANWDPTPPILPNIPAPQPPTLPPGVTEPGSSGSPLYSAQQRLVGVLSGGPSACGATGANLRDQYGGMFHAWEGVGTPTTRMKDHLDPAGGNPETLDGINACNPPASPTNISATTNGNNRIDVNWTAAPGITVYRVYRSNGLCPGTSFAQIGEVTAGTSFSDTTVSGGSNYSYRVTSVDTVQPCESPQSACDDAGATGVCALAPTFTGATTASSAQTQACGINVSWNAATSNCGGGGQIRYNVYRSLTMGFTPGAGNLVSSCVTGTSYADSAVSSGTNYSYVVRAEDSAGVGIGACAMGAADTNTIERSAVPTGPGSTLLFDNVESGNTLWSITGTGAVGANFAIVQDQSYSPTRSWFTPDPDDPNDRQLTLTSAITPTPGSSMSFWHRVQTEPEWDGVVLEYSLNNGTTWTDILAAQGAVPANANRFLEGGYASALRASSNPIGGRLAWHGTANTAFSQVRVNLADFANVPMIFRFRAGSDGSVSAPGYWLDDIQVTTPVSCSVPNPDVIFANGFE